MTADRKETSMKDQTTVPGLKAQLRAANRRNDRREARRVKALYSARLSYAAAQRKAATDPKRRDA